MDDHSFIAQHLLEKEQERTEAELELKNINIEKYVAELIVKQSEFPIKKAIDKGLHGLAGGICTSRMFCNEYTPSNFYHDDWGIDSVINLDHQKGVLGRIHRILDIDIDAMVDIQTRQLLVD